MLNAAWIDRPVEGLQSTLTYYMVGAQKQAFGRAKQDGRRGLAFIGPPRARSC
jgi:hypothetical protein